MCATFVAQLQTGERTLSTCVCEIGLGSSFNRCVTAKAVAVAVSKTSTKTVGALRLTAAEFYGEPNGEGRESEPQTDGDDVARLRNVEQLDTAQREDAG